MLATFYGEQIIKSKSLSLEDSVLFVGGKALMNPLKSLLTRRWLLSVERRPGLVWCFCCWMVEIRNVAWCYEKLDRTTP